MWALNGVIPLKPLHYFFLVILEERRMLNLATYITVTLVFIWSHHTPVDMIGDVTIMTSLFMYVYIIKSWLYFCERGITYWLP